MFLRKIMKKVDEIDGSIIVVARGGDFGCNLYSPVLKSAYFWKTLSFGRTSAGIVWGFWGMFHTIETTTMEYLIAELARNLMSQKNIWNQILVKNCISIWENVSTESHKMLIKVIFICLLDTKGERLVLVILKKY